MTSLAVAVGLLAVLTALNLFILLGVVRRLRTLGAAEAAPPAEVLPPVGRRVEPFTVTTLAGDTFADTDLAHGSSLVVMLSPGCSPCKDTAAKLASLRDKLPARTTVLIRTELDEPELAAMLTTLTGFGAVATFSGADGVEQAFGGRGYPTWIRVDDGVVTASSFTYYTDLLPDVVAA